MLVAATLAVLGLVSASSTPAVPIAMPASVMAVGVGVESGAAFCSGLVHDQGVASSTVAIANLAHAPRTLEVTTSDTEGRVVRRLLRIAPGRVRHLDPYGLLDGATDAISIVANGGGIAASEAISTPTGVAVAPCITQTAPTWYLGGGSTLPGRSLIVTVFNPTTTVSVYTVTFLGPNGPIEPLKYHDLLLRPHRLEALVVHDVAPNVAPITTEVSASAGNVVALGIQQSTTGASAVSLVPGSPALASTATFAITPNHSGVTSKLLLSNPSASAVTATVAASWSPGCGDRCAAPFQLTVPPGTTSVLQTAPSDRVPIGVPMASRLEATAPGLVVVQRVRTTRTLGQGVPLDDPTGVGTTYAAVLDPTGSGFSRVTITNPSGTAASVTLESPRAMTSTPHLTVVVAPHGVTTVGQSRLGWVRGGVVEVVSSASVYATAQVRAAVLGSDLLAAVPLF